MTYKLSDLGSDILSDVKTFCQRNLLKKTEEANRMSHDAEAHKSALAAIYEETARMGLGALFVPEENGGLALTMEDRAAILEEIACCDAGVAVSYMANCLATAPLKMYAGRELMDRCCQVHAGETLMDHYCQMNSGGTLMDHYCQLMLDGKFGAFCLTEDQAGSDISGILTRAENKNGEYVINGTKSFVTNGNIAGFYIVFARTDKGLSAFAVDGDADGISVGEEERKLGIRNSATCQVFFTDVKVPADRLIGEEGGGQKVAVSALNRARAFCAAAAVGVARRALELSIERAKDRTQFGQPLACRESIQMKLADMHMKIQAARLSCAHALACISGRKTGSDGLSSAEYTEPDQGSRTAPDSSEAVLTSPSESTAPVSSEAVLTISPESITPASSEAALTISPESITPDSSEAVASASAKCLAADAAVFCADTAVQIYGGYGYCEDYPVEKLLRDARIFQIFEGTDEVLKEMIGRRLTGSAR